MRLNTRLMVMLAILFAGAAGPASAFCGYYVAKGDSSLFNKASKVAIAPRSARETGHVGAVARLGARLAPPVLSGAHPLPVPVVVLVRPVG